MKKQYKQYLINNIDWLHDLSFIEIGTCNHTTLCDSDYSNNIVGHNLGIGVEIVADYLEELPTWSNIRKINAAVTDHSGEVIMYHVPKDRIKPSASYYRQLQGCNSINTYHPNHLKWGVKDLVKKTPVRAMTLPELIYENNVRGIQFLKMDLEGHDHVVMRNYHEFLTDMPVVFHPKRIQFESNTHTDKINIDIVIEMYQQLNYQVMRRDHDVVIDLRNES